LKKIKHLWGIASGGGLVDIAIPFLAVFTALVIGAVLIRISGASVYDAYKGLFEGMLGSKTALADTFVATAPYILTGLSVALGFQCGLFNIGAEGQFYMGALCSVIVGYAITGLPIFIHLPMAISAGIIGGCIWGSIPGYLKARFGAHEVINTIMMNYIGVKLVDFIVKKIIRDPNASVDRTPYIQKTAEYMKLFGTDYRIHAGVIIAIVAAILVHIFLYKTKAGFEIRTTGANPGAAKYSGMNVQWNTVFVMAIAGGLAGLAGAGEVLGLKHNLPAAFSSGYGYDAIAVAFLAKASPLGVLPAAFLWGGLRNGAGLMQLRVGVSIDLINVIQAFVIAFVAADPIVRWIYRLPKKKKTAAIFSRGWGG
jgi:simple sugar transport system permease protein